MFLLMTMETIVYYNMFSFFIFYRSEQLSLKSIYEFFFG